MKERRSVLVSAALAAVLVLAAGTRLVTVFSDSLSGDEIFQRSIVTRPYLDQLPFIRGDVHPPLYYWLTRAVSSVAGFGVFGLRLPAFIFGLLTVILTMRLAMRLFRDARLALAAGLLVSLSDLQILFSHFARSYAMLSALVLAYVLFLDRALRETESRIPWLSLAALSILMVYTHYFAWLYLAALFPAILLRRDRRALGRWLATVAVAALFFLPWIIYSLPALREAGGVRTVLSWIQTPTLRDLAALFARFTGPAEAGWGIILSFTVGGLCLAVAALSSRRPFPFAPFLWFTALVPPLLLFILASPPLKYPVWGFRHLLPSQAFWALLLAWGAGHFSTRKKLVFPAAVVLLACLQAVPTVGSLRQYGFDPYNRAADALREEVRAKDPQPVYVFSGTAEVILRFYLGETTNIAIFPDDDKDLPAEWTAIYHPAKEGEAGRIRRLLAAGFSVAWSRDFQKRPDDPRGLRVVRLTRPARSPSPG